MNGIDKITQKISADTKADVARIHAETEAALTAIADKLASDLAAQKEAILARGGQRAAERTERLHSAAQMEAKKLDLGARQEMIGKAFDKAIDDLCSLPEGDYIDLLTQLVVRASSTGSEAVIFSAKDRNVVGKQVVLNANKSLLSQTITEKSPNLPEISNKTAAAAIGAIVDVATAVKYAKNAQLTLSEETRDIAGGFILSDGDVEVNCAFDTLVRLQRENLEIQVADILFA